MAEKAVVISLNEYRNKKQAENTYYIENPDHERIRVLIEWLKKTTEQRMYPMNPEFW